MLAAVIYAVLIPALGFYAATFAAIVFLGWVLEMPDRRNRRLPQVLLTAVVLCGAFYVVFGMIFHVPFPTGLLL